MSPGMTRLDVPQYVHNPVQQRHLEANNLEDLYDIVLNGQWTITKQGEMARMCISTATATTKDPLDSYGFVSGALTPQTPTGSRLECASHPG